MKMQKAAFMRGTDKMILKEIEVPSIKDDEVLVSLEYVGICGSDVHYYHHGNCGAYKVDLSQDYMLGHECAGTITEVGKNVSDLKVGILVQFVFGVIALCGVSFIVDFLLSTNAVLPARFYGSEQEYRLYNITATAFFQLSLFYLFHLKTYHTNN